MSPDVLTRKLRRLSGSSRLARAAGLRNILVHLYEGIDYDIVATSVDPALDDFGAFVRHFQERLPEV